MGDDRVDVILGQWARERPDLDASPLAVIGRLSRVTRQIEDALRINQRRFGLTPDELAGALIVLVETKDTGKREAWAKRGAAAPLAMTSTGDEAMNLTSPL